MIKLLLILVVSSVALNASLAHEIVHKKITIYHPYLIIDKKSKAHAFLSIENLSDENEYLVEIKPKFCETYKIFKIDDAGNTSEIDLSKGLEIPAGGAVYFESETMALIFLGLNEDINWFNPHLATFVFKNAGIIELDFEVEP